MSTQDKPAYWQQHFECWKQSGLSQRDYCKQHKLTFSSFGYWRNRLKTSRTTDATAGKLIPVSISRPVSVNIYLSSGIRIEVPLHGLAEILPLLASEANG